jgi:hypothetical protein
LNPDEVRDVREQVLGDDKVDDVVDLVVITPAEDAQAETQLLLEDSEVDNVKEESLTEKE